MVANKVRNKILSITSFSSVCLKDSTSIKEEVLQYYVGLLDTTYDQGIIALMLERIWVLLP